MKILVISHNTPFPPNRGDKIRSFGFLRALAQNHEVHLLSLCKDPDDLQYAEDLKQWCASVQIFPLHKLASKLLALACIFSPFPMTFGYFFSFRMKRALAEIVQREKFDSCLVFCSSAAQYVLGKEMGFVVVDLVDVDSDKWRAFAEISGTVSKFIYSLESRRLRKWEEKIHSGVDRIVLTTERERSKLLELSPKNSASVSVVSVGVDLEFFRKESMLALEHNVVFLGQMDYLPNIDAVIYFYQNVWPGVVSKLPNARFFIVGRNPPPSLAESCPDAIVTGEVGDIREYLHRARVVVAPLRLSFGVQNKVLEAMASGVPVVATSNVAGGLSARPGHDLLVADYPEEFGEKVVELLTSEQRCREIASNALNYVQNFHHPEKISKELEILMNGDSVETKDGNSMSARKTDSLSSLDIPRMIEISVLSKLQGRIRGIWRRLLSRAQRRIC